MSQRKAEMVFELLDRATRPMRKLMRLQKRLGKAAQDSGRDAARGSRAGERGQRLFTRAINAAARAQANLRAGIGRTNEAIRRQVAGLKRSGDMMSRGGRNIVGGIRAAAATMVIASGALAGAGRAIVGPAAEFERYNIQLETLEGSAKKGAQAMSWIEKFAATTPLELNQVVQAFTQMRSFGLDPTDGSLRSMLDTMSASGQGFEMLQTQVLALGKAQTVGKLQGESVMMLMERGIPVYDILAEKMGKTVAQITEMQAAGELGRDAIALLIEGMGERNAGASDKVSKTWDGIISNLMDNWTRFRRMIADAGVFDHMKNRLRGLLSYINKAFENGQMQQLAQRISDTIMSGFAAFEALGKSTYRAWKRVSPYIEAAADAMGGYRNLAAAVAAIALRGVLFNTALGLFQIGAGAAMAVRYMAGLSFAVMARGVLQLGLAAISILNPLKWVRWGLLGIKLAFVSTGIGAILIGLAMAGIWIYNNWSGIKSFFKGIGDGMSAAFAPVSPMFEGIVAAGQKLMGWIENLVGPIEASEATWHAWGVGVGETIGGAIAWVGDLIGWISNIGSKMPTLDWGATFDFSNMTIEWSAIGTFLSSAGSVLWDAVPTVDWSALIDLKAAKDAWAPVGKWIGNAASKVWDKFPDMSKLFFWKSNDIEDPATMLAAAQAAEKLEMAYPKITAASDKALEAVNASMRGIKQAVSSVDLTSEGARIGETLAQGLLSQINAVRAAATTLGREIRMSVPAASTRLVPIAAGSQPVAAGRRGTALAPLLMSTSNTYNIKGEDLAAIQREVEAAQAATERRIMSKIERNRRNETRRTFS